MTFDPNNLIFFYLTGALLLVALALFVYIGTSDSKNRKPVNNKR